MNRQDNGDVENDSSGLEDVVEALKRLGLGGPRSSAAEGSPQAGDTQASADGSSSSDGDDGSSLDANGSSSSDTDYDLPHRPLFDLGTHTCQRAPRYLYRVDHPGSHSITDDDGTVRARDQFPHLSSLLRFRGSLERHFQWGLRSPSPFMSTFSSLDSTRNWTRRLEENNTGYGKANIRFYMVDTRRLGAAPVFDAEMLAADLDIVVTYGREEKPVRHTAEYLIKGSIDAHAIVHRGTWQDWEGFLQGAIQIDRGQDT
ncbi:hypothetical protein F503_03990 [Ophiostoma piceae UAMH 11346]|uniref:DUF7587 domain-containing protein n=1 Tax=Ophiostoma piceae (strain UAMH 11346) TaxID=1262450 RepID=S3BTA9_OPHP1|nr:hypothetical protein F503_03990 [Ophiostoma piceae UAMH 11346]